MKTNKKKISIIIGVLLIAVISLIVGFNLYNNNLNKYNDWKRSALTSPKIGKLNPAGDITITWKAINSKNVSNYKIYIDNKLIKTTNNKTFTVEQKLVKVKEYKAYIEADLRDGSKIYSNIFTFYINKKGFCLNKNMAYEVNAPDWGVSWYYNWSMEKFNFDSFQELEYVPMMWTASVTDKQTINRFHKQGYKYVLAYNEPDRPDQANIAVKDAVKSFADFSNQNLKVGSPATALCPPWSKDWFQPFMKKITAKGMNVDFIAVHHYWNWWTDEGAAAFIKLIDDTWEMYHKPIWITEFAIDGDGGYNEEQLKSVEQYMNAVLPELDKRDYVERYAWFSFDTNDKRNGASALLQHYTGEIRDLGKLYQKLGMPKGYKKNGIKSSEKNSKKDVRK